MDCFSYASRITSFLFDVICAAIGNISFFYAVPVLACVLVLSVTFLLSSHGTSIRFALETSILLRPIRRINRTRTSQACKEVQLELMEKWEANSEKYTEIQQRELLLLDERDIFDERRPYARLLSPADKVGYQGIMGQLSEIRPQLWETAQDFSRLQQRWVVGSWNLEFGTMT